MERSTKLRDRKKSATGKSETIQRKRAQTAKRVSHQWGGSR